MAECHKVIITPSYNSLQLWERLCPHKPLRSRITRQWTEIGFQGRNPVTDFRGMGFLGLQNLLWVDSNSYQYLWFTKISVFNTVLNYSWTVFLLQRFCASHYTEAAQEILQHSRHRDYGCVKIIFANKVDNNHKFEVLFQNQLFAICPYWTLSIFLIFF